MEAHTNNIGAAEAGYLGVAKNNMYVEPLETFKPLLFCSKSVRARDHRMRIPSTSDAETLNYLDEPEIPK